MTVPSNWYQLPANAGNTTTIGAPHIGGITQWEFLYQFDLAMLQRNFAICGSYPVPPTFPWCSGTVGALTNTTLIDTDRRDGIISDPWPCVAASAEDSADHGQTSLITGNRWSGFCVKPSLIEGCDPTIPAHYDLVIGGDLYYEPWKIIRVQIGSNGTYTLRFSDLGLESGELTHLVGKKYYIIRRGGYGWHERILMGNPGVQWRGQAMTILGDTQTVTVQGNLSGTTWKLNVLSVDTADIDYDASAGDVQSAINAALVSGSCTVIKYSNAPLAAYEVSFSKDLGVVTAMTGTSLFMTITVAKIFTGPTTTNVTFKDTTTGRWAPDWVDNQFVPMAGHVDIGFTSSTVGGYTRFGTIIANGTYGGFKWITFNPNSAGGSTYTPTDGGQYIITRVGGMDYYLFRWNGANTPVVGIDWSPTYWHSMTPNLYWSKDLDLTAQAQGSTIPVTQISGGTPDPDTGDCVCGIRTIRALDVDLYIGNDEICIDCLSDYNLTYDDFYSPNFNKSLRSRQVRAEGMSPHFIVPDVDYAGHTAIPNMVPATWFAAADINHSVTTGTVVTVDAGNTYSKFTIPPIRHGIPDGIPVYWAVKYQDDVVGNGVLWVDNPAPGATELELPFDGNHFSRCSDTAPKTWIYDATTVVLSYGFTRKYPAMMRYLYDRNYMVPDYDTAVDGTVTVHAPSAEHPGNWIVRNKSTSFAKPSGVVSTSHWSQSTTDDAPSDFGKLIESIEPLPGSGGSIRYMGDSFAQVTTDDIYRNGSQQDYENYIVRGSFEGKYPDALPPQYTGTITAAGVGWLTDASKHWLAWDEFGGYSGIATGGSSTTILDNTTYPVTHSDPITGDTILDSGDYRWSEALSTGRWNGFIVSIETGPCKGRKAPITATVEPSSIGDNGIITFDIPDFDWHYTRQKFQAANVEVGDQFTLTLSGDIVGTFTFTATDTSATTVANGLKALLGGIDGLTALVETNFVILYWDAALSVSVSVSTTNGGANNTQTLTNTTDTKPVEYKIHESAYMKHRWESRKVKVTHADLSTYTYSILFNDDNTLWMDTTDTFTVGDKFEILEYEAGWVYSAVGDGTWSKVGIAGINSERPDTKTSYGRMMHYDYWTTDLFDELKKSIKVMRWTKKDIDGWTSRADDGVAENNHVHAQAGGYPQTDVSCFDTLGGSGFDCACLTEALNYVIANKETGHDVSDFDSYIESEAGGPPSAGRVMDIEINGADSEGTVNSQYSYAKITSCAAISRQVELFVMPTFLETESSYTTTDAYGCEVDHTDCPPDGMFDEFSYTKSTYWDGGTGFVKNVFNAVATTSPITGPTRIKVGTNDLPDTGPCKDFLDCSTDNSFSITSSGYTIAQTVVVEMWDVAGGMNGFI